MSRENKRLAYASRGEAANAGNVQTPAPGFKGPKSKGTQLGPLTRYATRYLTLALFIFFHRPEWRDHQEAGQ